MSSVTEKSEASSINVSLQGGTRGALETYPPNDWPGFCALVRELVSREYPCDLSDAESVRDAKHSMVAIVPARIPPGPRRADRVVGSSIIGLDIDGAPAD